MSSPIRYTKQFDPFLKYAPPRVRAKGISTELSPPDAGLENWLPERQDFESLPSVEGDRALSPALARALEPQRVPDPVQRLPRDRSLRKILTWVCGTAGLAALGAWFMIWAPGVREFARDNFRDSSPAALRAGNSDKHDLPVDAQSTTRSDPSDDLSQPKAAEPETIRGIASASGDAATIASASPTTAPQPSPLPQFAIPEQAAAPEQSSAPPLVIKTLDRGEVALLIKRGEDLVAAGDLSSARLLLQRAAEAGSAQAALELAETFDPNVLEKLRIKGLASDITQAIRWYQRAEQFGSAEASRQLQQLLANADTNH